MNSTPLVVEFLADAFIRLSATNLRAVNSPMHLWSAAVVELSPDLDQDLGFAQITRGPQFDPERDKNVTNSAVIGVFLQLGADLHALKMT